MLPLVLHIIYLLADLTGLPSGTHWSSLHILISVAAQLGADYMGLTQRSNSIARDCLRVSVLVTFDLGLRSEITFIFFVSLF